MIFCSFVCFSDPFLLRRQNKSKLRKLWLATHWDWQLRFLRSNRHTSAAKIKQNNAGRGCPSFFNALTVETQDEIFPLARAAATTTVSHSPLTKMCSGVGRPPLARLGVGRMGRRTSLDPATHLGVEEPLPATSPHLTEVWKLASLQLFFSFFGVCFEVIKRCLRELLSEKGKLNC